MLRLTFKFKSAKDFFIYSIKNNFLSKNIYFWKQREVNYDDHSFVVQWSGTVSDTVNNIEKSEQKFSGCRNLVTKHSHPCSLRSSCCSLWLVEWQSGLAWAKITDTGRIGYKFGQICRECTHGDGCLIYVRPYDIVSPLLINH